MKSVYLIAIVTLFFSHFSQAIEGYVYSSKGYPYKNLIDKADGVKVYYQEDEVATTSLKAFSTNASSQDDIINCRVEVNWQGKVLKTESFRVKAGKFEKEPLATCLPRGIAKQYLADMRKR